MSVPPPEPQPRDDRPAPWMGAPGFTPGPDHFPPNAPMPGAPPYPAAPEPGPPPVGRPAGRTRFGAALGAAAVWAVVNLVLILVIAGPPGSDRDLGRLLGVLIVPTLLTALVVWAIARRRGWSFWLLVLVAAPLFWVLRALPIAASQAS